MENNTLTFGKNGKATLTWYQKVEYELPFDHYIIAAKDFMYENPNATEKALRMRMVPLLRHNIDDDLGEEIAYNIPTSLFDLYFDAIVQKMNETKEDE